MSVDYSEAILTFVRGLKNGSDGVDVDTDLIATGVLDSLAVMELVSFVSKNFEVKLGVSDITPANLRSVASLCSLVEEKTQ